MLKGIHGRAYIDLTSLVDLTNFDKLHPEICRSFALAKELSSIGSVDVPDGFMNLEIYKEQFKPLHKAYEEFLKLPETDPIKVNGKDFKDNDLSFYLKWAMGGYDLYSFYVLYDFEEGWSNDTSIRGRKPAADYFPGVIAWIDELVEKDIFSHIGRVTFFVQEAGGISFEHRDPSVDPEFPDVPSEFIHVRPSMDRPFYVRDSETLEKTYIDTRVGYWNDQDWHGGDSVLKPTYSIRIDGKFTASFKEKLKNVL
jgi:hypothetical protein